MRFCKVIQILALSFAFLFGSVAWSALNEQVLAKGFIEGLIDLSKLSQANNGNLNEESKAKLSSLSNQIDFNALALKVFGARWSKFSAQDRKDFLTTLRELLEVAVFPKAKRITAHSSEIQYKVVAPAQVGVKTSIEREKRGEVIQEKLHMVLIYDSKSSKLVDAVIEDEKVSANLKRQFNEALKKKTFRDVIVQMQKRVHEAKKKS